MNNTAGLALCWGETSCGHVWFRPGKWFHGFNWIKENEFTDKSAKLLDTVLAGPQIDKRSNKTSINPISQNNNTIWLEGVSLTCPRADTAELRMESKEHALSWRPGMSAMHKMWEKCPPQRYKFPFYFEVHPRDLKVLN